MIECEQVYIISKQTFNIGDKSKTILIIILYGIPISSRIYFKIKISFHLGERKGVPILFNVEVKDNNHIKFILRRLFANKLHRIANQYILLYHIQGGYGQVL